MLPYLKTVSVPTLHMSEYFIQKKMLTYLRTISVFTLHMSEPTLLF
jgi:hypothetical protein